MKYVTLTQPKSPNKCFLLGDRVFDWAVFVLWSKFSYNNGVNLRIVKQFDLTLGGSIQIQIFAFLTPRDELSSTRGSTARISAAPTDRECCQYTGS